MNLKDLIKKRNIGLKIRHEEWKPKEYAILTQSNKEFFEFEYFTSSKSSGKAAFKINNIDALNQWSEGWEIVNSDKIKKKLGVK